MGKYNKFWVALIGAVIVGAQLMFPDAGIQVPEDEAINNWLLIGTSVLTSLGVFAVPNKA